MVPFFYTVVETWPLSPNGKLDRRALPPPAAIARTERLPGRLLTADEQPLAEVWGQVLGTPPPGPHDNFFELGGDSILAMIAASRARHAGIDISVRDMFEHPTIAALAARAPRLAVAPAIGGATATAPQTPGSSRGGVRIRSISIRPSRLKSTLQPLRWTVPSGSS
jgi:aryl carrier-like protein